MFKWIKKVFSAGGDAKIESTTEPKRARVKGKYKADDKSTADVNEAWVGGEAPKKKKKNRLKAKFR